MTRMIRTAWAILGLAATLAAGGATAQPLPACDRPAARTDPDPMLRFRCANDANLRAMIADPRDLQRGRDDTPAFGDAAFAAAARHRLGEVKSIETESKVPPSQGGSKSDTGGKP
jgi:hypothetical protein